MTLAAFKTLEISNHTEQFIVTALRAAKALAVSLVAEVDGRVIGHTRCSTRSARCAEASSNGEDDSVAQI